MAQTDADIVYAVEREISADAFISVLVASGLAERRPVADRPRIEAMLRNADLIVTARQSGRLVGIARSITDFAACCYLADLAVDRALQGRGIGRTLMVRTRDAAGGRQVRCILLSAPTALGYYPKVGLEKNDRCFDFTDLS